MQSGSADQTVDGPNPEGPKKSHLDAGVIEEFAQNMSENIIQSFKIQMETVEAEVDCRASRFNRNQWTVAQEFATSIIEVALKEVFSSPSDHLEGSAGATTDGGSLDYPDAPPTTPLLPELERSRRSFTRKLKGGLATVCPPATPPTTPNDGADEGDPQVALVEHLMHSLAADDSEEGSRRGAVAFAETLSRDVVDSAPSVEHGEQTADDNAIDRLARRLTAAVITASLEEAKTLV